MKNIRIDQWGRQRCWNCGGINFTTKRTGKSWLLLGVGAVLTNPKQRCNRCGQYNQVGAAQQYDGPASKKYRAEWEREQQQQQQYPPTLGATGSGL